MGKITLIELIEKIESLDSEAVIFAVKNQGEWRSDSFALVINMQDESDSGRNPLSFFDEDGICYEYFLEVSIAQEVIAVRESYLEKFPLTPLEATEAVIHYAENDAYLL